LAKGWISVHRQIWDSWVWNEKPFSKGQAWVDMLLMVNHEDKKTLLGSQLILVKKGSCITSIRKLCERWGWSNTKVRSFLSLLEQDGMIVVKSDTKKTVLTIVNYSNYQDMNTSKNDTETTKEHHESDTKATRKHTNNNENNDNNENNTSSTKDTALEFMNEIGKYYTSLTGRFPSPKDEVAITELAEHTQDIQSVKNIMKDISDRYKPVRQGDKIKSFTYFVPGIKDKLFVEQKKKEVKPSGEAGGHSNEDDPYAGIGISL
jgi:predicted transcriptional regulator